MQGQCGAGHQIPDGLVRIMPPPPPCPIWYPNAYKFAPNAFTNRHVNFLGLLCHSMLRQPPIRMLCFAFVQTPRTKSKKKFTHVNFSIYYFGNKRSIKSIKPRNLHVHAFPKKFTCLALPHKVYMSIAFTKKGTNFNLLPGMPGSRSGV